MYIFLYYTVNFIYLKYSRHRKALVVPASSFQSLYISSACRVVCEVTSRIKTLFHATYSLFQPFSMFHLSYIHHEPEVKIFRFSSIFQNDMETTFDVAVFGDILMSIIISNGKTFSLHFSLDGSIARPISA